MQIKARYATKAYKLINLVSHNDRPRNLVVKASTRGAGDRGFNRCLINNFSQIYRASKIEKSANFSVKHRIQHARLILMSQGGLHLEIPAGILQQKTQIKSCQLLGKFTIFFISVTQYIRLKLRGRGKHKRV